LARAKTPGQLDLRDLLPGSRRFDAVDKRELDRNQRLLLVVQTQEIGSATGPEPCFLQPHSAFPIEPPLIPREARDHMKEPRPANSSALFAAYATRTAEAQQVNYRGPSPSTVPFERTVPGGSPGKAL
jgi:hypothetical protein